jgi:sec-independent protein translocase protein TatB
VFDNLGWWEIITLVLIGMFVFGPERLPKLVRDSAKVLRQVRQMARNATADLRDEIGTDIDLADLNPKVFVRKHLLTEEDERELRKPFLSAFDDLRDASNASDDDDRPATTAGQAESNGSVSLSKDGKLPPAPPPTTRYDLDAT